MKCVAGIATLLATAIAGQVAFNAEWGAILDEAEAPRVLKQCSREVPVVGGYWTPSTEMVRAMEPALARALEAALLQVTADPARRPKASDYYRQYVGIVVAGHRFIYANGFHRREVGPTPPLPNAPAPPDWRKEAFQVCDGWYQFFGAEYDPANGEVRNVHFNSPGFFVADSAWR